MVYLFKINMQQIIDDSNVVPMFALGAGVASVRLAA